MTYAPLYAYLFRFETVLKSPMILYNMLDVLFWTILWLGIEYGCHRSRIAVLITAHINIHLLSMVIWISSSIISIFRCGQCIYKNFQTVKYIILRTTLYLLYTLKPTKWLSDGVYISKLFFFYSNFTEHSLRGSICHMPALLHIKAWCQLGEHMKRWLSNLMTHKCVPKLSSRVGPTFVQTTFGLGELIGVAWLCGRSNIETDIRVIYIHKTKMLLQSVVTSGLLCSIVANLRHVDIYALEEA